MSSPPIHLLVALPAEAKPLIRAFGLKRLQPAGSPPRYANGPLSLTLSGPGMEAAGNAMASLQGLHGDSGCHWINLGIAGHARLETGACLLADAVTDSNTGEQWTLNPIRDLPATTLGPLRCVASAEHRYALCAGYDMESAAIARSLCQRGRLARLQILKVISDNPGHPSGEISAKMVSNLIERQLPTLKTLIQRLQTHAEPG
jgi:hypothetical protein